MNILTIKFMLMNDHQIPTRGWSDEQVLHQAQSLGIDTGTLEPTAPTAPTAPTVEPTAPTAPTVEPTAPTVEPTAPTAAVSIEDALKAFIALNNSQVIPEAKIIELIKAEVSKIETSVTKIEVTLPSGKTIKHEGVFHSIFEDAIDQITSFPYQLYLHGESGSGKSYTAKQLAAALDMPFYSQGAILTKFETLGSVTPAGYLKSIIRQWLESDTGLLCIDEIDSSNPSALVTIMAIFDDAGSITFPDGVTFTRCSVTHPIVVTANTIGQGASSKYNGRARLDAAFKARFKMLHHGYNDKIESSFASPNLVKYVRAFRAELSRKGLEGSLVTPRHTKMIGALEHHPIEKRNRLINQVLQQGLSDSEFASIILAIGAL